jgi:6-phosphogluconolactonase (cycloisomerase 2 family)
MFKRSTLKSGFLRLLITALVIFPLLANTAGSAAAANDDLGAVYTMTNAAAGNAIQVYERMADGTLSAGAMYLTGGLGSGTGLGSQGALVLSQDNRWLFAVNAGSSEISVFTVQGNALTLVDKESSHGSTPISLTFHKPWLYVLNAGSGGSIAGFRVSSTGQLTYVEGSMGLLSNNGVGPAPAPEQIGFTPDGHHLVVSEKGSNLIDTYSLDHGIARGPVVTPSAGPAPYGFGFNEHGLLVISEAAHSAVSSYKVGDKGLKVIKASLSDTQVAACWLVVTANGSYAYAANAGSGTISGYRVSDSGKLALLMAFGSHDQFLYVLASGTNMINAFAINSNGSLQFVGAWSSPAGASGLAAR